jgi:fatty-acyl-CoA synthase
VAVPDEKWGEKVVAVVIRQPGMDESRVSEDDIKDCCKDTLASYKRPKDIIFINPEEMPRTPNGKISHVRLRDQIAKKIEQR